MPSVACDYCYHNCLLEEGRSGICSVITNDKGNLVNKLDANLSYLSLEPIEKRPFFHFYPGSKFMSAGLYGCQFFCEFCMNFKVSQTTEGKKLYKNADDLVNFAKQKNAQGVAFSFNEPTLYWEYLSEVSSKIITAVKTNGYASEKIMSLLSKTVKAFNVDIKGNDNDYKNICGGTLSPVLQNIEFLSSKTHLEISYLPLPSRIHDTKFHEYICDFLCNINKYIPVHILYFYPFLRMSNQQYPPNEIMNVVHIFKKKMNYVYVSNIHYDSDSLYYRNTRCSCCDNTLIDRQGKISVKSLECCGEKIKGVFV